MERPGSLSKDWLRIGFAENLYQSKLHYRRSYVEEREGGTFNIKKNILTKKNRLAVPQFG